MQDIGGCRAAVGDVAQVHKLVSYLQNKFGGNSRNYIKEPKSDGYHIHLVVRHGSGDDPNPERILRTEIQVRSALQHERATVVETVDLFTGQNLKTGGGEHVEKIFRANFERIRVERGMPRDTGNAA